MPTKRGKRLFIKNGDASDRVISALPVTFGDRAADMDLARKIMARKTKEGSTGNPHGSVKCCGRCLLDQRRDQHNAE
jgi:hypothetical protein